MAAKNKSNELKLTRIYDAPVKTVWDAWIDPDQVARWWGPRGFTLTTKSKDVRPGGTWIYTMHGPDGTDWPNRTTYHEVETYKRLVYDHGASDDRPALFRVTVIFTDLQGKTKMDLTMALPTPEAAEETRKFSKKAGGDSTWDRLAEYLSEETQGQFKFIINRSFAAPMATLFEMWAQPQHISQWLPPTGFQMEFLRAEVRPGGKSFYRMFNETGMEMYGRCEYLEIRPPHQVIYTQQFCDRNEKVSRHPMAPTWPETMLTSVTFHEEGPDQTRVTVTWEPYGPCTKEELATFLKERAGMTLGWTGSFDKLETLLAQQG